MPEIINQNKISNGYQVDEYLFDPLKLKEIIKAKLKEHNVQLHLNRSVTRDELSIYDIVIIATYSNNNLFIHVLISYNSIIFQG